MALPMLNAIELEALLLNVKPVSYKATQELLDVDELIIQACRQGFITVQDCLQLQQRSNSIWLEIHSTHRSLSSEKDSN